MRKFIRPRVSSALTTPTVVIGSLIFANCIPVIINPNEYSDYLWVHIFAVLSGLAASVLLGVSYKRSGDIFLSGKYANHVEKILFLLSICVIFYLNLRADVSPLEYIQNLNYYRLAVNKDVGYAKIILNLWMIIGTVVYLKSEHGFMRYVLIPGLLNVFFGYRFCFAFSIFSIFFFHLLRSKIRFHQLILATFIFIGFSFFAVWRDAVYQNILIPNIYEFLFDFSDSGLIFKIIEHGFLAHFVVLENFTAAINFADDAGYHYGAEYFLQIFRLIGLENFLALGPSVDIQFNANLRGIDSLDLLYSDAGGVVIGLPGSLYIAGGSIGIIVGSFIWAFSVSRILYLAREWRHIGITVFIPYILVIYQSPETNIPRIIIMISILWAFFVLTQSIDFIVKKGRIPHESCK